MKNTCRMKISAYLLMLFLWIVPSTFARPQLTLAVIGENTTDSASWRSGVSTVLLRGSGQGLVKKEDNILYMYGTVPGDFDISAYCSVVKDTLKKSESGIAVRTSLNKDAGCLSVLIQNERGMVVKYRTADGKELKSVSASATILNYMRIRRSGNVYSLFGKEHAADSWTPIGSSYTFAWPYSLYAGVVHSSGDTARITHARFDEINNLPEEPSAALCEPLIYDFNSGVALDTLGFREIGMWALDSALYIRTTIPSESLTVAHILTPPFSVPVGTDTVRASWNFSFSGDTTPYLYDYGLYSTETMTLNHRAKITAPRIGCAGKIISGTDDTLYTSLYAVDSVFLYDRTKVFGKVTTGKKCTLINNAAVYDTMYQNALVYPPVLPVYPVSAGTTSKTVADSVTLLPGNYNTVNVYSNAKIRFTAGLYQFASLKCSPQARLIFDVGAQGRIRIWVRDTLQLADRDSMVVVGGPAASKSIELYTNQIHQLTIGADARLYGRIFAPHAEVRFVSRGIMIDGGLYARKISCEPDVAVVINTTSLSNDILTTKLIPKNSSMSSYTIACSVHRSAKQDTITDITVLEDTIKVASYKTGIATPVAKTLAMSAEFFTYGTQKRLRLLYNNGFATMIIADTLPVTIDTLCALSFDFRKNGYLNPVIVHVDHIALSCAAESCPPVIITSEPVDATVLAGTPVTFSCGADAGTIAPTFQWYRNSISIPYANLSTHTVISPDPSDNGATFYCRITGACSDAQTSSATLSVVTCTDPVITAQPNDTTVSLGHSATFTVNADGYGLTIRWKRNDDKIPGAYGTSYTIPSVNPYNNLDRYHAVVTNSCGKMVQSTQALLTIPDAGPCRITSQPRGDTLLAGDYFSTGVSVICDDAVFAWYKNNVYAAGQDKASLLYGPLSEADDSAEFYCIVNNGTTADTSWVAKIRVLRPNATGGSIAVSGELHSGDGSMAGSGSPEKYDFKVKLYTRKTGGNPIYTEEFLGDHGVNVLKGEFTVTLGKGNADANLQKTIASAAEVYAELYAGKQGGMELLAPRLRLTAAPYAFTSGVKLIYGAGNPATLTVSAPIGTMYVDRSDGDTTWKLAKTGWVKLE